MRTRGIAPQEQTSSATVGPSSGDEPMNSQYPRPDSPGSSSARSHTPSPSQDMRAKAGEAASKISDAAREASGQAKQAASSLASDVTKQAKGLLNMQVTAGADMVDHVADSARAAAESLDLKRRRVLAGSARPDRRRPHQDGVGFHPQAARARIRPRLAGRFSCLPRAQEQPTKRHGARVNERPFRRDESAFRPKDGPVPWHMNACEIPAWCRH